MVNHHRTARHTRFQDLTGQTFGRLTVVSFAERLRSGSQTRSYWDCRCVCGKTTRVEAYSLKHGGSRSCGCLHRESVRQYEDLTGQTFFRLTVISLAGMEPGSRLWNCRCACGEMSVVRGNALKCGRTRSCGCLRKESTARMGRATKKHGRSGTPEFRAWQGIMQRCYNRRAASYRGYGGRGIRVFRRWHKFENFLADMGGRPSADHSLDRIDNDGPYSLENCRWATRKEQQRNRQCSRNITLNGSTMTLSAWAEERGLNIATLHSRLRNGWTLEEALMIPSGRRERTIDEAERTFRNKARRAVRLALKRGTLVKPDRCEFSDCTRSVLQAHHWKGYDSENHLNVLWLCSKHHTLAEGCPDRLCLKDHV